MKSETSKPPIIGCQNEKEQQLLMMNVESSFGDVSSIMIAPDQMYGNFNLLEDEDASPNKKNRQ